ncbi:MAG: MFS transporter [Armatimonadia bacterium]|nr:MFS transporter [Armatimonadia bacterium]
MSSAEADQVSLDRRTFTMGVVNGSLFNASMRLIDATVVVSPLAERLVGSDTLVGLLQMVFKIGWMWPALFMPYVLEGVGRRLPWYRGAAGVRMLAIWGAVILLFSGMADTAPTRTFGLLALCLFLSTTFGGVSWIPFMDVIAKGVPANKRGLLWGLRQGIAGVLGVGFATVVSYMLSAERGFDFPRGYAWLFLIAACAQTIALTAFSLAREPKIETKPRRMTFRMHMWRGPRILGRDSAYRAFALSRAAIGVALMGMGFLAICGQDRFALSEAQTSAWLLPVAIAGAGYPFLWGFLNDRFGSRTIVRATTLLVAVHAALPLLVLTMERSGHVPASTANWLLGSAVVVGYAAMSCYMISSMTFVLEIAAPHQRDGYLGLHNSLAIPLAFSSLLAGAIAEHISYLALYATCLVVAVIAMVLVFTILPEPRPGLGEEEGADRLSLLDQLRARTWPKPGRRA